MVSYCSFNLDFLYYLGRRASFHIAKRHLPSCFLSPHFSSPFFCGFLVCFKFQKLFVCQGVFGVPHDTHSFSDLLGTMTGPQWTGTKLKHPRGQAQEAGLEETRCKLPESSLWSPTDVCSAPSWVSALETLPSVFTGSWSCQPLPSTYRNPESHKESRYSA